MVKRDLAKVKLRVRFSYLAPTVHMSGKGRTGSVRKDGELDKVLDDVVVYRLGYEPIGGGSNPPGSAKTLIIDELA